MTFNPSLVDATAIGPAEILPEAAWTPNSSASMSVHEILGHLTENFLLIRASQNQGVFAVSFEVVNPQGNYCLPESASGKQSSTQVSHSHSSSQGRRRELEWRRTHQEELQQYAGQYVILEGETIIAHGQDPMEIIAEARAQGIRVPYIFFVDDTPEGTSQMGL